MLTHTTFRTAGSGQGAVDDVTRLLAQKYLTKNEMAAVFRITPRTLDSWCSAGRIPFCRIGGRTIRFDLDAVVAHVAASHGIRATTRARKPIAAPLAAPETAAAPAAA